MEIIPLIINGKKSRKATVAGRDYLVAPASMIVPGVLNGSEGPILYPAEVVANNPDDWNGMPMVVYHPIRDGKAISARTPEVLETQEVGRVYNSQVSESSELQAEAWFDLEATRRVDSRVMDDLEAGRDIELSTGLFAAREPAPSGAVHNGVSYNFTATFLKPDHLAILPDKTGACSLKDGCGILLNNTCEICGRSRKPLTNADKLSHDVLRDHLSKALYERYVPKDGDGNPKTDVTMSYEDHCYLVDVYDKDVVYSRKGKFWKSSYSTDLRNATITLSEDSPVEVRRVVSYKEVTDNDSTVTKTSIPQFDWDEVLEGDMTRNEKINYITANCDCWNKAEDKKALEVMNDDQINRIHTTVKKGKETPPPSLTPAAPVTAQGVGAPVINNAPQVLSPEQINQIAAAVAAQVTPAVISNVRNENEKSHLLQRLTMHISDETQRAQVLASYSVLNVEQLRPLAAVAPPLPPALQQNWLGAGGAPPTMIDNSDFDPNDLLPETHEWADERPNKNGRKKVKVTNAGDDDEE